MKIKRINTAILLLALAGMTLTGCSNEDIVNVNPQEEGAGNVSFSIVEKDYEPADNTPKSRAAEEEMKPEVQDLGDGLIAEVSLVPDTTHRVENPKTRAINTPTHYTIQAFQGGVKKGELKGTFNGSTFTPDAGQPKSISLPHGTYDFVCFNDGVTASGTQLTVNRADAGTARFDVRRNVQINQDPKQQVKFTMKHAGAAINIRAWYINFWIDCKTTSTQEFNELWGLLLYKGVSIDPAMQYKYKLETPASAIPETMVYDLTTNTSSSTTMGQISKSCEADMEGRPVASSTPGDTYFSTGSGLANEYCLPTTDCSKFKMTFTFGELFGSSLVGKSLTIPEHKLVESNKRYTILVRFYCTDQYLYSDGTAGLLSKNPGKTPIAVILNPSNRIAVALHDVNEGGSDQTQWSNATSSESSYPVNNYSELFRYSAGISSLGAAMSSVNTYTPVLSGKSWRIASLSETTIMWNVLGRMIETGDTYKKFYTDAFGYLIPSGGSAGFSTPPSSINFPTMNMTIFNQAFTKVGGTPPSGTYWTTSECKVGSEYKMATVTYSGNQVHLGIQSKTSTAKVRPFISY